MGVNTFSFIMSVRDLLELPNSLPNPSLKVLKVVLNASIISSLPLFQNSLIRIPKLVMIPLDDSLRGLNTSSLKKSPNSATVSFIAVVNGWMISLCTNSLAGFKYLSITPFVPSSSFPNRKSFIFFSNLRRKPTLPEASSPNKKVLVGLINFCSIKSVDFSRKPFFPSVPNKKPRRGDRTYLSAIPPTALLKDVFLTLSRLNTSFIQDVTGARILVLSVSIDLRKRFFLPLDSSPMKNSFTGSIKVVRNLTLNSWLNTPVLSLNSVSLNGLQSCSDKVSRILGKKPVCGSKKNTFSGLIIFSDILSPIFCTVSFRGTMILSEIC